MSLWCQEYERLFQRAKSGDISILYDSETFTIRDDTNSLPLHYLGSSGRIEILDYVESFTEENNDGYTPYDLFQKNY